MIVQGNVVSAPRPMRTIIKEALMKVGPMPRLPPGVSNEMIFAAVKEGVKFGSSIQTALRPQCICIRGWIAVHDRRPVPPGPPPLAPHRFTIGPLRPALDRPQSRHSPPNDGAHWRHPFFVKATIKDRVRCVRIISDTCFLRLWCGPFLFGINFRT